MFETKVKIVLENAKKTLELAGYDVRNSMEKNSQILIFLKNQEISDDSKNKINSFKNIDFHPLVQKNITKMKYDLMTPIQKAIIPYILESKDCLGCAETGSGKTIAFLTPIISLLLKDGPPKEDEEYLKPNSKYMLLVLDF